MVTLEWENNLFVHKNKQDYLKDYTIGITANLRKVTSKVNLYISGMMIIIIRFEIMTEDIKFFTFTTIKQFLSLFLKNY